MSPTAVLAMLQVLDIKRDVGVVADLCHASRWLVFPSDLIHHLPHSLPLLVLLLLVFLLVISHIWSEHRRSKHLRPKSVGTLTLSGLITWYFFMHQLSLWLKMAERSGLANECFTCAVQHFLLRRECHYCILGFGNAHGGLDRMSEGDWWCLEAPSWALALLILPIDRKAMGQEEHRGTCPPHIKSTCRIQFGHFQIYFFLEVLSILTYMMFWIHIYTIWSYNTLYKCNHCRHFWFKGVVHIFPIHFYTISPGQKTRLEVQG